MLKPFIYNSDLKVIEKKAAAQSISIDEADLLRHKGMSESRIQQGCRSYFRYNFPKARFIQIDNGGRMGRTMRMTKGKEGTIAGMKDVMLIGENKISFVEFKKVGSPAEIEPTDEQKEVHEFLLKSGFKAYFCNNMPYFRKVICEEFLK
jgi:hypothetical protein